MVALVDLEKCSGCGECKEVCPSEAIKIEGDKAIVDKDLCTDCGACEGVCPTGAISMS